MPSTKTTINLSLELRKKAHIEPFGNNSASYGVSKIIDRYTYIIAEAKKELLEKFTSEELSFLKSITENVKLCSASEAVNILTERISGASGISEADKKELENRINKLRKIEQITLLEIIEN